MNCRAYWLLEYTLSRSRGMKATRSNLLLSVTMSYKAEVKSWLWGHCGPGSPPHTSPGSAVTGPQALRQRHSTAPAGGSTIHPKVGCEL